MPSGGYRQPANPAPASGPGALSRRTDGPQGGGRQPVRTPTGGTYGQAQQLAQLQQGAPLAASPGGTDTAPGGGDVSANVIPFGHPTQQPDTPVTAGAAAGAGPGPEALGLPNQATDDMRAYLAWLPVLAHMADQPGSSTGLRNLVRQLKSLGS